MSAKKDEILSREEIQRLLERNNSNPEIGRPVYEPWTNNKLTGGQASNPDYPLKGSHKSWTRRLNSATFRLQMKGAKEAKVVTRQIKTKSGWIEVPLNDRN